MTQDNVPKGDRTDDVRYLGHDLSDEEGEDLAMMELVDTLEDDFNTTDSLSDDDELYDDEDDWPKPERDDALLTFDKHTGSIFAAALSPDGKLAASGGDDDTFFLWSTQTGDIIFQCKDFRDSVTHVEFSSDGKYIAAVDMLGKIVVWKIVDNNIREIYSETIDDVKWLKWHPQIKVLLVGSTMVWLIKIPSGQQKLFHNQEITTDVGLFMPDGKRAVVGYDDGSSQVIDLASGNRLCKFYGSSTTLGAIISIAVHPNNELFAVGSVHSQIAIYKTEPSKIIGTFDCYELNDEDEGETHKPNTSVESLAFGGDVLPLIVAGTDNAIHVIDHRRMAMRHFIKVREGLTRFIWPENSQYIYVGTKYGTVNIYNPLSGIQMVSLSGHYGNILDLHYSKDSKLLVTAGDDHKAKIFALGEERPL